MACHAVSILEEASIVPTLAAALKGVTRTVATTARERAPPAPLLELLGRDSGCLEWLLENETGCSALIFGREDSGLTNDELSFAQRTLKIPSSPLYSSLNLSHAVAVVSYELAQEAHRLAHASDVSTSERSDGKPQSEDDFSRRAVSKRNGQVDVSTSCSAEGDVSMGARKMQQRPTEPLSHESDFAAEAETTRESVSHTNRAENERGVRHDANSASWHQLEQQQEDGSPSKNLDRLEDEEGLLDAQAEKEPVESARPGWRRSRRLDRAKSREEVADQADAEGALQQAEELLAKMGFLKGDTRGAKVPKLRQLLMRAAPTNAEVALLRAILRRMDWHVTQAQQTTVEDSAPL